MSQENPMVYDLLVNNALLFDGSAVRDGLLSVGIAGNKISFVGASAAQASKEIDAAGRFLMPGLNRLPCSSYEYVDRERRSHNGSRYRA
jgi:N-acyl-D-aspartate/D-glutamate deacylase